MKIPKKQKKLPKIGKKFVRSQFEFDLYKDIKNKLPPKTLIEYEAIKLKYQIEGEYTPDFIITKPDGNVIFIEAKGNGRQFDQRTRQKMVAVKKNNPHLDIRIVFYSDGKIGPIRKDNTFRRQSDWAKAEGFPFSIRTIPEEWLT